MLSTSKARFVKHEPCSKCGSRDNLARYSDGSAYCFGCGAIEKRNTFNYQDYDSGPGETKNQVSIPKDASSTIAPEALTWLTGFGLTIQEIINYGFLWSPSKKWLIYPVNNKVYHGRVGSFQLAGYWVRQFNGGKKNLNFFQSGEAVHFVGLESNKVVLVEDIVSAIKVGRHCTAVCLFGSNVSSELLGALVGRFEEVRVWLDHDKFPNALRASRKATMLGLNNRVILTDRDPKTYSDEVILGEIA